MIFRFLFSEYARPGPGLSHSSHPNIPSMLPTELVDHILSFLLGDRSALEQCSKAHPMLSRLAEPYLYADILIDVNNKAALSELYKLLSENPHILKIFRTFKLTLCF